MTTKPVPPEEAELRRHPVLAALDEALLAKVSAGARALRLGRGETLFRQDDPADRFYLVRSGQVKLFRIGHDGNEKIVHLAGPGESFAEAVMFMRERSYPVHAAAVEDAELVAVPTGPLRETLAASVDACLRMLTQLSMRLRERVAEIEALSLQNGALRLANFLLREAPEAGAPNVIRLTLSKKVIASRLSLQPETLSRLLRRFEDRGLIRVNGPEISMLDRDALEAVALAGEL
jgi:CRP-like cAMP-binding protein